MSGHCKDCKHWDNERFAREGWGKCRKAAGSGGDEANPGTLAYATDGDAYYAELITRPEFGCVMFEAKE